MKKSWKTYAMVFGIFCLLTIVFYRTVFIKKEVPIPGNLLVSFFSPWRYESWSGYPNGVPNKPIGEDNLRLFFPPRKLTIDEFRHGRLPLWNPYTFGGTVLAATYQSAVFYPLNILYGLLSFVDAWTAMIMVQPVLVGVFMFLFLMESGLSRKASFFGALCYAFSNWMIVWWEETFVIVHSILWLPLGLAGVLKLVKNPKSIIGPTCITLAVSMSISAGFLQLSIYLIGTIVVFYLWQLVQKYKTVSLLKQIVMFSMAMVIAFLISAIQWLPAIEAYLQAPRQFIDAKFLFETNLMPFRFLVTVLFPDFYGNPASYNYFFPKVTYYETMMSVGIVTFVFALFGLLINHKHDSNMIFWKLFTLATFSLGFRLPTSWLIYWFRIPILSASLPSRIFALSTFGFCVLAAYGMDQLLKEKKHTRLFHCVVYAFGFPWVAIGLFVGFSYYLTSLTPAGLLTLCQKYSMQSIVSLCQWAMKHNIIEQLTPYGTISLRNLVIPTVFLLFTFASMHLFNKKTSIFYCCMIIGVLGQSLYFSNKYLYFSERRFVFPSIPPIEKLKEIAGVSRVWGYGNAYVQKNLFMYDGIFSPDGYDGLYPGRYGELLHVIKNDGVVTKAIARSDADLKQASEKESMIDSPIRLRLMSLLGVHYILETKKGDDKDWMKIEKRFPPSRFQNVWESDTWRIWQYTNALPRAFLLHAFTVLAKDQDIISFLLSEKNDLSQTIVLEHTPEHSVTNISEEDKKKESVRFIQYTPETVQLAVNAVSAGYVFLSDNDYPGWNAYIDNKKTSIYRANYTFRAVYVPEGYHEVSFRYEPVVFTWATRMTAMGGMAILTIIIIVGYRRLKDKKKTV